MGGIGGVPWYQPYESLRGYPHLRRAIDQGGYGKLFPFDRREVRENLLMYCKELYVQGGAIRVFRDRNWRYRSSPWHTYTYALQAQDILENQGLALRVRRGFRRPGESSGLGTVLSATPRFSHEVVPLLEQGVRVPEVDTENLAPVIHKSGSQHIPYRGDSSRIIAPPYLDEGRFVQMINDMEELNDRLFSHVQLTHSSEWIVRNVYLTRMFNAEGHGRLFQKGGRSYQNIPKDTRKEVLLNGSPVGEPDFVGSHIQILYSWADGDWRMGEDPYMPVVRQLTGGHESHELRKVAKRCFLIAVNCRAFEGHQKSYRKAMQGREVRPMVQTLSRWGYRPEDVFEAIVKVHAPLQRYLCSSVGNRLMFEESEILVEILKAMMHTGLAGVPLHDSIICRQADVMAVEELMKHHLEEALRKPTANPTSRLSKEPVGGSDMSTSSGRDWASSPP